MDADAALTSCCPWGGRHSGHVAPIPRAASSATGVPPARATAPPPSIFAIVFPQYHAIP